MFCVKCGHELREDEKFCTRCGTRTGLSTEQDVERTRGSHGEPIKESEAKKVVDADNGDRTFLQGEGISDEVSEYSTFDRIAIKFGDVLDIILGIVFLILSLILFSEGAVVLGVIFLASGLATVIGSVVSLFSRAKKNEYSKEDIKKKKRNMVIAIVVIIIVVIILV